ncbi:DMT family transporter [Lysinibacillus fusiformis]|uniref:DMT family transporter n=1 Tax=Lysinibacillus fusiformis TaxID=28031 RepID=UPI0023A94FCE|nr:DMT family transporter [Lysinibacillus fusiformis]WEA41252.1 DMT family transporter [Lysinibacillus fusiformis]
MIKRLIWLLPLLSGAMFGGVGIFVRKLDDFGMDSFTVLSSRVLVATILIFLGLFFYNKSLLKIKLKDLGLFIATGILGMLGLNYCYNESINHLTLSFAAVLLSLSPLFVFAMAIFIFKEKVTVLKISSMFLAIFGCLLASGILDGAGQIKWSIFGISVGLLSAFFYALYGIFSRLAMQKHYDAYTIIFYSLLMCTIVLLPLTDWSNLKDFVVSSPVENTIFMFLHSICTSILPYLLYTISLKYMDTSMASILAAGGEPIAAMSFGVFFFSEIPTIISFAGIIITIIALILFCKPPKQPEIVK